ncbi:MAG: glycosyltransferase [Gemmatimonadota bacterium]|nr:MAG: glycosyltransferase [Gemmatimonadota bacterium]
MLIQHVVAPAEVGGLERVVQALAIGHRERGHDVRIVVVLDEDGLGHPFLAPFRRTGVQVFPLPLAPRRYLKEREFVARLCQRGRPDVVHTHGYRCDVVDSGAARRLGIPTVTTVHGFTGGGPKNRLYEWLQRRAYRRFDAVVAVSRVQLEQLADSGVPRERLQLLPNAWSKTGPLASREEARRRLRIRDGGFQIGWVGRLSREKGLDVLLQGLTKLEDLAWELSVLGVGREEEGLRSIVRSLGLEDRVGWLGNVRDAGRLFGAFDLFVLSSRTEGVPMVLFEAMAAETPIVATRVGGVPDVVSDQEALLVAAEDPAALATAIRAAHDDRVAASTRAAAARRRLDEEFAVEPWLERYETLYRRLNDPVETAVGRS